ncbi:MAG: T9SS type A sorting domain-containing protein [Bacteroidia bacterium]
MMKKLLSLLIIGSCAVVANAQTGGTACTPDQQYAGNPGIYPDTVQNLPPAVVGAAYDAVITAVVPSDTTVDFPGVGIVTLTINYMKIDSAVGHPASLDYACNPADCSFPGNSINCISIYGTPQAGDVGTYPLTVYVTANVTHALLGTFDAPQSTVTGYQVVVGDVGVEVLDANKFQVAQNIPNPANGSTTINFTSPSPSTVDFKVYNMLGMVVKNNKIDAVSGMNKINFNTNELAQGVYVYAITNGNTTITKRMVVSGK